MTATRQPEWRERLSDHLAHMAGTAFVPGQNDCALFVAGCVAAMTGTDFAAEYRGRYRTLKGGLKQLQKAGYRSPLALIEDTFGEVHPAFAQVGDIAVVPTDEGEALCVVTGEMLACLNASGLAHVPRSAAVRAFRVI